MEPFATLVAHLQQFGCIELAEDRVDVHCFYETSFIASVIDADRPIAVLVLRHRQVFDAMDDLAHAHALRRAPRDRPRRRQRTATRRDFILCSPC